LFSKTFFDGQNWQMYLKVDSYEGESYFHEMFVISVEYIQLAVECRVYRGADKFLARPGRKQASATEDFHVHISYLLS
jgi:hypothetical protein